MTKIAYSALFFVFSFGSVSAITIGEIVNPLEDFLECKDLEWYEKAICEDAAQRIYGSLNERGIGFSSGDIIMTEHPVTAEKQLDTGHSCTHRAWIKDNYATARLLSDGSLNFSGNGISKPLTFMADFPINFYARVYLKETAGVRNPINGNCQNIGTDHFYADSNVNTRMYLGMSFSLEPELLDERTPEGDYQVQIAPIFIVESQLRPTEINFTFHDKDGAWMGFITFLTTLGSNMIDITKDVFDGGGISDTLKDQIKLDIGVSVAWVVLEITDDWLSFDLAEVYASDIAMEYIERQQGGLDNKARELEDDIGAQISMALGLDVDGKRIYVVDKDLVNAFLMSSLVPALNIIQ